MKFKTTEKEIRQGYSYILSVPYCGLETLLQYESPIAYTCGKYDWKADIYDIRRIADGWGDVAIVTGYAPFGNYKVDSATYAKYETAAIALREKYSNMRDSNVTARMLGTQDRLLDRLLDEVINGKLSTDAELSELVDAM